MNLKPNQLTPAIFTLLFISGACALVYQVVWARLFNEIFGSTLFAVSAVLAAFKSGKPEAAAEQLRVLETLDPGQE